MTGETLNWLSASDNARSATEKIPLEAPTERPVLPIMVWLAFLICQRHSGPVIEQHQANLRILEGAAKQLGIGLEKVGVAVDAQANTSAASGPLALDQAVRDGRIKLGHLVALEAMDGGLTWGAAAIHS